jgi:hypothetical protein
MIGNTPTTSLIARIERNQEPDDAIPIELIHANPDDDNYLYHISDYEVENGEEDTIGLDQLHIVRGDLYKELEAIDLMCEDYQKACELGACERFNASCQ